MSINTILITLLIIGISIALILHALSKFSSQSDTAKIQATGEFSTNLQEVKEGVDELKRSFGPLGKNNKKRPMIFEEVAEIKRLLSERMLPEQSLPLDDGDKQLLLKCFSEMKTQIESLDEIIHRIGERPDESNNIMNILGDIRSEIDAMPGVFKQTQVEGRQLLEDLSSKLALQLEAEPAPVSLNQGQMREISDTMQTSYERFLGMLDSHLNVQGFKRCKWCNQANVPVNGKYCHNCGEKFDPVDSPPA